MALFESTGAPFTTTQSAHDSLAEGSVWIGQTLTCFEDHTVTSMDFVMIADLSDYSTGTVSIGIRYASANGTIAIGSNLISGSAGNISTLPIGNISDPHENRGAIFSSAIQFYNGYKYAIFAHTDPPGRITLQGFNDNEIPNQHYRYGEEIRSTNSGVTWATNWISGSTAYDLKLRIWGSAITTTTTPAGYQSNMPTSSKRLVAIGNNQLWYEGTVGAISAELTAARDEITTSMRTAIFEGFGKLFIANDLKLKVADFTNVKLSTASCSANPPDFGNILTGGTSLARIKVDYVTSFLSASLIYGEKLTRWLSFNSAETLTGTDNDGNSISFVLNAVEVAPPHFYDWKRYGDSATYGTMPGQASLGVLYRGRCILAGDKDLPYQWYMSRQGNPWDWNYLADDAQAPVAGRDADAGLLGDVIVALIPYKDDYLIIGCANSMWIMRGDPAAGGSLDELTRATGIFSDQSWCWDAQGNFYFYGISGGIYRIPADFSAVENISIDKLPNLATDWAADPTLHRIILSYDRQRIGIVICKTTMASGVNTAYWYDLRTGGFFPESYPAACAPFCAFHYESLDPAYRKTIFGCNDGYLRVFDDADKDDDIGATDALISSYVTLGPYLISPSPDIAGKLVDCTIAAAGGRTGGAFGDSDDFAVQFYRGDSAEQVLEDVRDGATAFNSVLISAVGRSTRIRTKIRGPYMAVKISSIGSTQTWSYDNFWGTIKGVATI